MIRPALYLRWEKQPRLCLPAGGLGRYSPAMPEAARPRRLPPWLKRPLPRGTGQKPVDALLDDQRLHTVCEEARCPNKSQCFTHGTATFMILGDTCTRACRFCSVKFGRPPAPPDPDEPRRLAEAAARLRLSHVVITSVDRDDQPDGGAAHWAAVVRAVRQGLPAADVEVLTPDFQGRMADVDVVLEAGPRVFNHNIEVVARLFRAIQPQKNYQRSLAVLQHAASRQPAVTTKSGLMVGLGETREDLLGTFADLRAAGVQMLTVGQYLKPEPGLAEVERYYEPAEFDDLRRAALAMGFSQVAAGPFVRSSYNAKEQFHGQA